MRLILTLWCIVAALGGVVAVGVPVQWLIRGRRRLDEADWIRAPVMGLAAIIVALVLLAFVGVRVGYATAVLWAVTAVLWVAMARRGAIDRAAVPLRVAAIAAAVFLLHGIGLVWAGADVYVGRGWSDQLNYVSIAQFLLDAPWSRTLDQVGLQPYLVNGIFHKHARIGQSVVNGFLAATTGQDAKATFEPTILLGPALVFAAACALWRALANGAVTRFALSACAGASLLPGLATLHLEGFLSQSVSLPFLFLWPVLLRDLVAAPGAGAFASSALVCMALTLTYPEVLPLLLAMSGCAFVAAALVSRDRRRLARDFVAPLLPAFLLALTPALEGFVFVLRNLGRSGVSDVYPWAFRLAGITRLWAGDLVEWLAHPLATPLGMVAAALTGLGFAGLGLVGRRLWRDGREAQDGAPLALVAALAFYVLTPIAVVAAPGRHAYQFYKLASGVVPVVALGLAFLPRDWLRRAAVGTTVLLAGIGTAGMALQAGRGVDTPRSLAAHDLMSSEVTSLARTLGGLRDRDVVLLERDVPGRAPGALHGWFAYFARANRVWLGSALLNQHVAWEYMWATTGARDLARVPQDAVFLTSVQDPWTELPPNARVLWAGDTYRLWTARRRGPWAALVWGEAQQGLERVDGKRFAWLGVGDVRLLVLAGEVGAVRFSAVSWIGSSGGTTRHLRVRTSGGWDETIALAAGPGSFRVPVSAGAQEVRLTVLERDPPRGADPRSLTLGLYDVRLEWSPEP